ncbi:MAG: hypothetical protein PHY72_02200 [Candidatus Pacebacteria bacterium]|nr:hypothetical protein [Candidatus Paceibacterota bacterium]
MLSKKFLILPLLIGVVLLVGFLVYENKTRIAEAGAGQNVKGFAWSDLIGWISANSSNCDTNNDGISEGVPPACPVSGTVIPNYGLNIADNGTTGIFSGYAWSEHVGWISFNQADLTGCPSGVCRAEVDKATGVVSGWAKFLTTGDWLKLKGTNYGFVINKGTGEFSGYAWGDVTAGLVSASCQNNNRCASNNYKLTTTFVMNVKPIVVVDPSIPVVPPIPPGSSLPNPNPAIVNVCSNPAYNFYWNFGDADGDTQSKYQIQIVKTTNGSWVAGTEEVDTGIIDSSTQSKQILLAPSGLAYNRTYKWRIMVWDSNGGASDWVYGVNFTTPIHASPTPNFTWTPLTIVKDQEIQFCSMQQAGVCFNNASVCYGASAPLCTGANFLWTFPPGIVFVTGSNTTANPKVKFSTTGSNQPITLQITDDLGPSGQCSIIKNINVILPLPKYQEVLPQ